MVVDICKGNFPKAPTHFFSLAVYSNKFVPKQAVKVRETHKPLTLLPPKFEPYPEPFSTTDICEQINRFVYQRASNIIAPQKRS